MVKISELLFPLLAEFGLSEEYNRRRAQHRVERQQDEAGTDDGHQDIRADVGVHSDDAGIDRHEKRALGEGERAGHLLAPEASSNQHHAEGKENDAEGQEVHLGRLEFRPDGAEAIRKEVLPANRTLGVLLDENGQLSRRSARAVGAIPQVSDRRFALGGEVIPGLIGLEGGEVGSEVHAPSKPCGCREVNTFRLSRLGLLRK